ncbi:conserved Plasmodium protein, unknown function, partial [Plasmodium malariae]
IQCRSILYKYLNSYNEEVKYNLLVNVNNLNVKTYVIYIVNSLYQIYNDEGVKGLYKGLLPMLAHIISKKSIYYLLEYIHFVILKRMSRTNEKTNMPVAPSCFNTWVYVNYVHVRRKKKKKDMYDDKKVVPNYENSFVNERDNVSNFIGDSINCKIVKHMNFVKEENNFIKKKKKKKFFNLSFYHGLYEYISCILSYPLLNISTKLIIFQNNSKSLIYTCLNTIVAPYIQYAILNRSQSLVPGLCKDITFSQFFYNFHWKGHLSNVSAGLAVAGIQLI